MKTLLDKIKQRNAVYRHLYHTTVGEVEVGNLFTTADRGDGVASQQQYIKLRGHNNAVNTATWIAVHLEEDDYAFSIPDCVHPRNAYGR